MAFASHPGFSGPESLRDSGGYEASGLTHGITLD